MKVTEKHFARTAVEALAVPFVTADAFFSPLQNPWLEERAMRILLELKLQLRHHSENEILLFVALMFYLSHPG